MPFSWHWNQTLWIHPGYTAWYCLPCVFRSPFTHNNYGTSVHFWSTSWLTKFLSAYSLIFSYILSFSASVSASPSLSHSISHTHTHTPCDAGHAKIYPFYRGIYLCSLSTVVLAVEQRLARPQFCKSMPISLYSAEIRSAHTEITTLDPGKNPSWQHKNGN